MSQKVKTISVSGRKVGLVGLDQALAQVAASHGEAGDEQLCAALLEAVRGNNYIPASAQEAYAQGLLDEMHRFLGRPVARRPGPGMEVRVIGTGCPRCEGLMEKVMQASMELDLPVDADHVKDAMEIALLGRIAFPGLLINGRIISQGADPTYAQVRDWLCQAADQGES